MNNKKIIFMGTPLVAKEYLEALIKNKIDIKAVFTQSPKKQSRGMQLVKSPVHLLAIENKIDVYHPIHFDLITISQLKKLEPDLIIVMAYGKLLPKEVLELPKNGCINIHVSILPRWRGAAPIEHALMNGDKDTGISLIKLIEKLDAGPIIAQEKMMIPPNFNKAELMKNLTIIGTRLLINSIPKIFTNDFIYQEQDEEKATYAKKITSEKRKINFNNLTIDIINQIRAHSPKPGAWFYFNNERIKIIDAKPGLAIGKTSTILNKNFEIGCSDGSIDPLILQREGKKIITKDEFLRGFKFQPNSLIDV